MKVGTGLDSLGRENNRVRDKNEPFVGFKWLLGCHSLQTTAKHSRVLDSLIEYCTIIYKPLFENPMFAALLLQSNRSRLVQKVLIFWQALSLVVSHVFVIDCHSIIGKIPCAQFHC